MSARLSGKSCDGPDVRELLRLWRLCVRARSGEGGAARVCRRLITTLSESYSAPWSKSEGTVFLVLSVRQELAGANGVQPNRAG
jgi:hypothetical protein